MGRAMGKWLDRARQNVCTPQSKSEPPADARARWDAEDWRAFFDECAATIEHDGGAPRHEAERAAFQHCVARWLGMNPPTLNTASDCIHCGAATSESNAVRLTVPAAAPAWLHTICKEGFRAVRRASAIAALARLSVAEPTR